MSRMGEDPAPGRRGGAKKDLGVVIERIVKTPGLIAVGVNSHLHFHPLLPPPPESQLEKDAHG